MKPRTLLVLALLVVGLGAFVWFGRELPSSSERLKLEDRVLRLEAEDVEQLDIEGGDGRVVLVRQPEGDSAWRVASPVDAPADGAAVEGLVRRLVALKKQRDLEDVSRDDVGLAEPRGRVRLKAADGETVLEIGAEIPASANMTLAVEGRETFYVVSAAIWEELTVDPDEWRDRRVFQWPAAAIERVVLHSDGTTVSLRRDESGFLVDGPTPDRADQALVSALLSSLSGLVAERFIGAEESVSVAADLDASNRWLEVEIDGVEEPVRIVLGQVEGKVEGDVEGGGETPARLMNVGGTVLTTRTELDASVTWADEQWRSKDLVTSDVYSLTSVEITEGEETLGLERDGSNWRRDGELIEFAAVTDFLYEISDGRAERVVAGDSLGGLDEPTVTIRLTGEALPAGASESETLTLFAAVGEEVPARVTGREVVLLLSAQTAMAVRDKLAALRAAGPLSADGSR